MRGSKPAVGKLSVFFFLLLFVVASPLAGEASLEEKLSSSIFAETFIPVFGDEDIFDLGFGGAAAFEYYPLPFLGPFLHVGGHVLPVTGLEALTLFDGGLGAGFLFRPSERIRLKADILGGFYTSKWRDYGASGLFFGVRGNAGFRITPAITLLAHGAFSDYVSTPEPFLRTISAGLSVNLQFSELGKKDARIDIKYDTINPIFPVFYSYYDDHTFGTIQITNQEESTIKDVSISVYIPEYMSQPRRCGEFEELAPREDASVPLYALFNDEVLELTENTKGQIELIVEYRIFGFKRSASIPAALTMHHRNAMTWNDDRKAAAFVSPTDPAVLWFSRFAAGIVRNRTRGSINRNLQYGMGMFEALGLYGINYVIDPNSSYIELSEQSGTVDYLQFPHQTLFYRGGDCDDLSILYAALMESIGIRTGFITIPGHIYMAFSLDISESRARDEFYDPAMLIYIDGEAWVPVEITMVNEGFLKAWRIGAKEWTDNVKTDDARFYPMAEAWQLYKPVSIPNVTPRFSLPKEVETVNRFDAGMDRYIAREIEPFRQRIVNNTGFSDEKRQNALGILFGRYGLLDEAWKQFSKAAKTNYPFAWNNLGNIAFLQKDYELAISYYEWALNLNKDDPVALLGIARSQYELENLIESDKAYALLSEKDPDLAADFGYLASIYGGEGRAWSFSDRLSSTVWAEDKEMYPDIRSIDTADEALAMGIPEAKVVEENESTTERPVSETDIREEPSAGEQPSANEEPDRVALAEDREPVEPQQPLKEESIEVSPDIAAEEEPVGENEEPEESAPIISETRPEDIDLIAKAEEPSADAEPEPDQPAEKEPPAEDAPPAIATKAPEDKELEEKAELEREREEERNTSGLSPVNEQPEPAEKGDDYALALLSDETSKQAGPEEEPATNVREQAIEEGPPYEELPYIEEYLENKITFTKVLDSFDTAKVAVGDWSITGKRVVQEDKNQLYAKLALSAAQGDIITKYSFSAQSTGKGWTGLGIHIYRDKVLTHAGYGEGNSILIWVTSDSGYYDDNKTRLQIYRSHNDTHMVLLESTVIPDSIFDVNDYEIFFDKVDDSVSVRVNGIQRLELKGFSEFTSGEWVIFRALDTAEFADFQMEVLQWKENE